MSVIEKTAAETTLNTPIARLNRGLRILREAHCPVEANLWKHHALQLTKADTRVVFLDRLQSRLAVLRDQAV
jgi:hypothetical protein